MVADMVADTVDTMAEVTTVAEDMAAGTSFFLPRVPPQVLPRVLLLFRPPFQPPCLSLFLVCVNILLLMQCLF